MDHPKFTSSESDFEEEEPEDDSMFSRDFQGSQGKSTATRRKEEKKKSDTPVLDNYSTDLTQRAMDGKMDPVVGRENEIQRVAQILNRKKKNNPVLIGEPGVGKSAIVEGLSQRIVSGQVPSLLAGKRLLSLDLTAVVSGGLAGPYSCAGAAQGHNSSNRPARTEHNVRGFIRIMQIKQPPEQQNSDQSNELLSQQIVIA